MISIVQLLNDLNQHTCMFYNFYNVNFLKLCMFEFVINTGTILAYQGHIINICHYFLIFYNNYSLYISDALIFYRLSGDIVQ